MAMTSGSSPATAAMRIALRPASVSKRSLLFSRRLQVAFTGEYDGNRRCLRRPRRRRRAAPLDLSSRGRICHRLDADGKKSCFHSWGNSFMHFEFQLYTVPVEGGFPEGFRFPSPKMRRSRPTARTWLTSPHPVATRVEALPRRPDHADLDRRSQRFEHRQSSAREFQRPRPQWVGDTVYFLSDRNGPVSLFAYDTKSKQVTEALHSDGLDFKTISAGPDAIVIEQFGPSSSMT